MQEHELYTLWNHLARLGQTVEIGSHTLRVLQSGELNLKRGPDFRSARFALDGVVYQGSVEFHVHRKDWYLHGHDLDRAFSDVLIHLVGEGNTAKLEPVSNRYAPQPIPTYVLPLSEENRQLMQTECPLPPSAVNGHMQTFGELAMQRFVMKTQRVTHALQQERVPVLLYRLLLRALGYQGNEDAFERLAAAIPAQVADHFSRDPFKLYALFSGQAGFLPEQPADDWTAALCREHALHAHLMDRQPLSVRDWRFAGVRPQNHPHFRLAGWVALMSRYGIFGFADHLDISFEGRKPYDEVLTGLKESFMLPVSGYWQTHGSLAKPCTGNRHYFGPSRIMEMLINVILPLQSARAIQKESEGYYAYIRDFYLRLPATGVYAGFKHFYPWLEDMNSAHAGPYLNQALRFLKQQYCDLNGCAVCPLLHDGPESRNEKD